VHYRRCIDGARKGLAGQVITDAGTCRRKCRRGAERDARVRPLTTIDRLTMPQTSDAGPIAVAVVACPALDPAPELPGPTPPQVDLVQESILNGAAPVDRATSTRDQPSVVACALTERGPLVRVPRVDCVTVT
jgi:hypothetical protein